MKIVRRQLQRSQLDEQGFATGPSKKTYSAEKKKNTFLQRVKGEETDEKKGRGSLSKRTPIYLREKEKSTDWAGTV